jgi:hypothetical protein
MYARENSNARAISRPLILHQGSDRESTDGDEGPSGKQPPDAILCLQNPSINSETKSNPIDIVHHMVSFVNTRWRFLFLGMCASVSFGWYFYSIHEDISYFCYDIPAPLENEIEKVIFSFYLTNV